MKSIFGAFIKADKIKYVCGWCGTPSKLTYKYGYKDCPKWYNMCSCSDVACLDYIILEDEFNSKEHQDNLSNSSTYKEIIQHRKIGESK